MEKNAAKFTVFLAFLIICINLGMFFFMRWLITLMSSNPQKTADFFRWLTSGYKLPIFIFGLMFLIPLLTLLFIFIPLFFSGRHNENRMESEKTGAELEEEMKTEEEEYWVKSETEKYNRELRRKETGKKDKAENPIIKESGPFDLFR